MHPSNTNKETTSEISRHNIYGYLDCKVRMRDIRGLPIFGIRSKHYNRDLISLFSYSVVPKAQRLNWH